MTARFDFCSLLKPVKYFEDLSRGQKILMRSGVLKIFYGAFFLLAVFIHSYRFWEWGAEGFDSIFYQRMGIEWARGRFPLTIPEVGRPFFLPVMYGMSALFYKVFGEHDYTLKIMNLAALAGISLLLLLIARQRRLHSGFAAAPLFIFLFLPRVILQTRVEMPHLLSTFFVLLSFYFLNLFRERCNLLRLAFSALALHAAAFVHSDLVLLGPGFLLILLIDTPRAGSARWKGFFRHSLLYGLVFLLPFLFYFAVWGREIVLSTIHNNQIYPMMFPGREFPVLFFDFTTRGLAWLLGVPLTVLLYLALAAHLLKFKDSLRDIDVLIPPAVYFFLFDLVITRNVLEPLIRVMIPLVPFAGLYLAGRLQVVCEGAKPWKKIAAFTVLTGCLLYNFKEYHRIPSFAYLDPGAGESFLRYETSFRHVHERLKKELGPGEKILTAPSLLINTSNTYNLPFYFNGRAVHLRDCSPAKTDFESFLKEERIRYVFIGVSRLQFRDWPSAVLQDKGLPLCFAERENYDPRLETEKLMEALAPFGPEKIYEHWWFGIIYRLNEMPAEAGERS